MVGQEGISFSFIIKNRGKGPCHAFFPLSITQDVCTRFPDMTGNHGLEMNNHCMINAL